MLVIRSCVCYAAIVIIAQVAVKINGKNNYHAIMLLETCMFVPYSKTLGRWECVNVLIACIFVLLMGRWEYV